MIENNEFFVYSVGANCVRPLDLPEFQAGDQWSPLQTNLHSIKTAKRGNSCIKGISP